MPKTDELGIGRYADILNRAGVRTTQELTRMNARQVRGIPGVGPVALGRIEQALAARGLALAPDEWDRYVCARDGEASWDAALESLYLCDVCAEAFTRDPFGGKGPEFVGGELDGFCLSCNELRRVRLRQWFLCGVCARVTKSIGRGVIAARFVMGFWKEHIAARIPELILEETDPPTLQRREGSRGQPNDRPDLTAFSRHDGATVFGLELKSGRSSVGRGGVGAVMGRFQLDQSDCDNITSAIRRLGVGVYLIHVQVIDRAAPPTTRFVAVDFWWTDVFAMSEHFQDLRQRPRENRPAAYFDVGMFRPARDFAEHVASRDFRALADRFLVMGVPALYRAS